MIAYAYMFLLLPLCLVTGCGVLGSPHDGTIEAVPLEWELPEVFGDIVTGFASTPAIPSDALTELRPRLQEVYGLVL